MSKRLQVVLPEAKMDQLRRVAASEGMTVSAWVRRVLDEALAASPGSDVADKMARIRAAAEHAFPTADIDRMLEQIAAGRSGVTVEP